MDEGDLERILKQANKLKLLDVRGCSRIGDSGLVRLEQHKSKHYKYSNNSMSLIINFVIRV